MKSFDRRRLALIATLPVCFVAAAPAQPLIQNGDFEITSLAPGVEPPGYYYRYLEPGDTNITGWVTTLGYNPVAPPGFIEYIRGYFQDPLQPLGGHVELGFYYTLAGIQQTFATVPNLSYTVNFYLASNPLSFEAGPAIVRVSAGGNFVDYAAAPGSGNEQDMGWQLKQFNFIADNTGNTTLQFWNVQGIAAIDGVSIVPEPQCYAMLSLAAGCFLTSALKRRRGGRLW